MTSKESSKESVKETSSEPVQEISKELSCLAAQLAADKKATDVMIVRVAELLEVTDYFVIATVANRPQAQAVIDAIEDHMRDEGGRKPIGREGLEDGQWSLLDYGDFVVHIFLPEAREFYRLENLWGDAPRIETEATRASVTTAVPVPSA